MLLLEKILIPKPNVYIYTFDLIESDDDIYVCFIRVYNTTNFHKYMKIYVD